MNNYQLTISNRNYLAGGSLKCSVLSTIQTYFFSLSIIMVLFLFVNSYKINAQSYTLDQVIAYAQEHSPEAMRIATSKENKYWQYKTFKAEFKPQLLMQASLPDFRNQTIPVRQNDGSIVNRRIKESESIGALSLEQNIGFTGGVIKMSSDLTRFDNYLIRNTNYKGSPFFISLEQPLFSFNRLKWMKMIEPFRYQESQREYIEGNEKIAYNTSAYYFNLLLSQINYQIAKTNKSNADTIYNVGLEKSKMGRISKNELLQLKFGVISAQKAMATASLSIKTSMLSLTSYTGMQEQENINLDLPSSIRPFEINDSLALKMARENSKSSLEFKRQIMEAERDADQAQKESGLNAMMFMSYGNNDLGNTIMDIYDNPQPLQTFNVGLAVPILDGGRSKAARKTANANLKLVEYTLEQEKINFRQQVITQIESFRMLQRFIEYTAEADQTAAERYEIARLRYIAGDISLTEYNIALQEKDRAKQDYITALRNYWLTYYTIRILTLYDFENNAQLASNNNHITANNNY